MTETMTPLSLQAAIEAVETLSPGDQMQLVEIIRQRLIDQRRDELVSEIAEAREAYGRGEVRRGTVADLLRELSV